MTNKHKTNFILADPAWKFETRSEKGKGRSPERHYKCSSLEEMCAIPVESILMDDALLFMWVTMPMLFKSNILAKAWGFEKYSGSGFMWVKTNKTKPGLSWGLGYGTRKNVEPCLVFKRGKGIKRVSGGVHEVIMTPRGRHSEKPIETFHRIEELYGDNLINPTELFARNKYKNWSVWGDGIKSDFEFKDSNGR
jgi:N6-adenosine-specific RNA methylase IME4